MPCSGTKQAKSIKKKQISISLTKQFLSIFEHLSEAKVSDLDVELVIQQDVLRLQISVDYALAVHVSYPFQDLSVKREQECVESYAFLVVVDQLDVL